MKLIRKVKGLVPLTLCELAYGDTCPSADNARYLFIRNSLMYESCVVFLFVSQFLGLLQLLLKSRELAVLKLSGLLVIAVSLGDGDLGRKAGR